ncbi:hypothetical protein EVG20_g6145 [Dentipellis fragilis]|uniref:Uncharacterized protein n=1 Tax=Dentipellis fragilis TaxID=205917 RepID=A0A4Y9YS19_9AGAM|nr:hypothetical protein EVG20_g6145 [Dentipellis fragilis]
MLRAVALQSPVCGRSVGGRAGSHFHSGRRHLERHSEAWPSHHLSNAIITLRQSLDAAAAAAAAAAATDIIDIQVTSW